MMRFHHDSAEIFVPDSIDPELALSRTTHMAIGAHQDDIEIMAAAPILECFQKEHLWFTGVVVTDGRGSPRSGLYKQFTNDEMHKVRIKEQHKAAIIGEYAAQVMLDYSSKVIKDNTNRHPVEDISAILRKAKARSIYTHNLADKHDTHVAVALKVIAAIRSLPKDERPQNLFGCEVWRDLDWMVDSDKVLLDLSEHENLQAALVGIFDSQIAGGKRYDLASMARRYANATYLESHGVDVATGITYAMDLTPLIDEPEMKIETFVQEFIQRLSKDVTNRLNRVG
jgi:LmbE family N-acetylglucosaminyl deacetylase